MNQQPQQTVPDWIVAIGTALPEAPCGEDPRYLDAFQLVKEEIDKLRKVDYAMIMATCRDLLTGVTKDLRVAGYHLTAGTYVDGLPGLLDGLRAYRVLLDTFWEDCHPKSETGRLAALNLLGNPRIVAFAEQKADGAGVDAFKDLQQEIGRINAFLIDKLGEEAPRLTALDHWVGERLKRMESPAPKTEAVPDPAAETPAAGAAATGPRVVDSEQAVETLTRQIHGYSMRAGSFLQAMAYSRAFRWGKLAPPPNEGGRTRIPAPRASGLAELQNALAGQSLQDVLTCCENLFFEPGFHLLFDLQYQAFQYVEANQRPDLAGFIRNALQDLLQRHPQLLGLQFDDGSPFAGLDCRQWIQQWEAAAGGAGAQAAVAPEADAESAAQVIDRAMQLAKRKNLTEALRSVQCLPAGNETQRIEKRLTEARLCLAAGKAQMAEMVLAGVQKYILAHHLATWDPDLAVEVLRQRLAALQALEKCADGQGKPHIAAIGKELRRLICEIDVIAAAALI
jgi:type VI secretion system protein VasJ